MKDGTVFWMICAVVLVILAAGLSSFYSVIYAQDSENVQSDLYKP